MKISVQLFLVFKSRPKAPLHAEPKSEWHQLGKQTEQAGEAREERRACAAGRHGEAGHEAVQGHVR